MRSLTSANHIGFNISQHFLYHKSLTSIFLIGVERMSEQGQYDNESKVDLDISFESNSSFALPINTKTNLIDTKIHIQDESHGEIDCEDVREYRLQTVHGDEKVRVNLNISFDHNEFDPIPVKENFTPVSKMSQGIT